MAWEKRGPSGQTYYYRSKRVNGKVVKDYHTNRWGTADCLSKIDALERQRTNLDRMMLRCEIADWNELDGQSKAVCDYIATLVNATLTAAGYHRQNRDIWRKKRATEPMATRTKKPVIAPGCLPGWTVPETKEARRKVVSNGFDGKEEIFEAHALACLRAYPGEIDLRTGESVKPIIDLVTATPVHREIVEQQVERKRAELAGPNASPLESLLIDRILACWLSVDFYEKQFVTKSKAGSMAISVSEHLQKRIDTAQKRYLAAIKTLAQVRRLQIPVNVQINVAGQGGQQVNIAGNVMPQTPERATTW